MSSDNAADRGAGARDGGEGRASDLGIVGELHALLAVLPDVNPGADGPPAGLTVDPADIEEAERAHWRYAQPPFSISVEVAPGNSWSGYSPADVRGPAFEQTVAERQAKVRAENPKAEIYPEPKIIPPGALLIRAAVAKPREAILTLYGTHKPTWQRLVAQHRVDEGWRQQYQVAWRLRDGGGWPATVKGARDVNHWCTYQAAVLGSFLENEHVCIERIDGLEAALLCDYCCVLCKAEALRMIGNLMEKLDPAKPSRIDDAAVASAQGTVTVTTPRSAIDRRTESLKLLEANGGSIESQNELARLLGIDRRNVYSHIDELVATRCVRLRGRKGRKRIIEITRKGRERLQAAMQSLKSFVV